MPPRQPGFTRAQRGILPGARAVRRRCITKLDLPGRFWRRVDRRTYRTGYAHDDDVTWAVNARSVGSVSAWCAFVNRRNRMYLQVQLVPLASVDDAPAALEAARAGELNNFRNRATTLSNDVVELGQDAVPGATNVTATEREIDTGGERSLVYSLYFNVGRYVVILVATDLYGGWEWNLVLGLRAGPGRRAPAGRERARGTGKYLLERARARSARRRRWGRPIPRRRCTPRPGTASTSRPASSSRRPRR